MHTMTPVLYMLLVVSLTIVSSSGQGSKCPPGVCATVQCAFVDPRDCPDGTTFEENGGYCGCCSACVSVVLQPGEKCKPGPGQPKCLDGFQCGRSGVCEKNFCHKTICSAVRCADMRPELCTPGTELVPKAGLCGCCDACLRVLRVGEGCGVTMSPCARGLHCGPSGTCETAVIFPEP